MRKISQCRQSHSAQPPHQKQSPGVKGRRPGMVRARSAQRIKTPPRVPIALARPTVRCRSASPKSASPCGAADPKAKAEINAPLHRPSDRDFHPDWIDARQTQAGAKARQVLGHASRLVHQERQVGGSRDKRADGKHPQGGRTGRPFRRSKARARRKRSPLARPLKADLSATARDLRHASGLAGPQRARTTETWRLTRSIEARPDCVSLMWRPLRSLQR